MINRKTVKPHHYFGNRRYNDNRRRDSNGNLIGTAIGLAIMLPALKSFAETK